MIWKGVANKCLESKSSYHKCGIQLSMVSKRIKVTYLFHEHLQRDEDHGVKIPIPEEIIDFINRDAGLRSPSMTYQMLIQNKK